MSSNIHSASQEHDILKKAMKKAIEAGWEKDRIETYAEVIAESKYMQDKTPFSLLYDEYFGYEGVGLYALIFNHDFAKALWGEDTITVPSDAFMLRQPTRWEHHLRNMVIAPDPIKYLGENI